MAHPTLSDTESPPEPGREPLSALTTAITALLATLAALVMVATLSGCASA